jgi:hypothetical protein
MLLMNGCHFVNTADYYFSCSEPAFLQENFHPTIFSLLPWEILTAKSGFSKGLAAEMRRWRADGAAFLQIADHRNEAVAERWELLPLAILHCILTHEVGQFDMLR